MTFSVIIPVYNRTETLKTAIESVLCQTFRDFEIIVADDGSDETVKRCLKPYMGLIRYIRLDKNRGVSAARNAGIKAARGEYIAFLDSDDIWLPDKLEAQHMALTKSGLFVSHTEEFWFRSDRFVNKPPKHAKQGGRIFEHVLDCCRISPSSAVIHRSVFKKAGYFDEGMRVCEDYDLWLRICSLHEVNCLPRKHIIKRAVTDDQLSASIMHIEFIRLVSLARFVKCRKTEPHHKLAALREIDRKSGIILKGINNFFY